MATTYSWAGDNSGDWTTGSLWAGGVVPPNDGSADVIIDVTQGLTQTYTATISAGEPVTVDTLTLNAPDDGTNHDPYLGGILEMDGTLTFDNPGSVVSIDGSLQSWLLTNSGTFINAGTVAPFIQGSGNVLFEGTNGFYVENELQSSGTVTVDTSSIAELISNTLTDGIYSTNGDSTVIDLGGTLGGLQPDIQAIEGPQANPGGWTELTFTGTLAAINQWTGTAYESVATTLTHIMGGGTVDVKNGAVFDGGANTLTVDHTGASNGDGILNVQAGTVLVGEIDLNGGILQGNGTITAPVVNNGTISAVSGALDLAGAVTGTGTIVFDQDFVQGTVATGSTLTVGSVSAGQTVVMNGRDTLVLTSPGTFAGAIEANTGDQIILQGETATSAVVHGGTLDVNNGGSVIASLRLQGSDQQDSFSVSGSTITVGTVSAAPSHAPNDFAGNGTSDILFENSNSGELLYWQMANGAYQQDVPLAGASAGWQVVGTGDFTGNGTSDILFENADSGLVLYWQLNNGAYQQGVPVAGANSDWQVVGTGDFTGNGTDDILFQNTSGEMLYWQMQNGTYNQAVPLIGASSDWKFLGTGDFTGNGTDDILFQNANSGELLYWQMQNGQFAGNVALDGATSDWKYVGVGDFNGNGVDDILFQNTNSNAVLDWQLSNGTVSNPNMIGTAPEGYSVVGTGHYGGGSTSDILLANASGSYIEWQISNGQISQTVPVGGATSDWKMV